MTVRSFYGSSFPATYYVSDNQYSTTFEYFDTISDLSPVGVEIDDNPVAAGVLAFQQYDLVVYAAEVPASTGRVDRMSVSGCESYFSDYVRGGVFVSCYLDRLLGNDNSNQLYPDNYYGDFQAICGNTGVSSEFANYYGYVDIVIASGWSAMDFRFIPFYSSDSPIYLDSLEFQNLLTYMPSGVRTVYLGFLTPYMSGDWTDRPPQSNTTASGTTAADWANVESGISQMNSGIDDLNSGIDEMHSDIVSGVSDIVSALIVPSDSLGDLVLDPIDTLPQEYDYDDIIDTAAEVIEDIPPGIVGAASLWGMLDMLFGVDSTFVWLIPLAVFMCIAAWVLYRTG